MPRLLDRIPLPFQAIHPVSKPIRQRFEIDARDSLRFCHQLCHPKQRKTVVFGRIFVHFALSDMSNKKPPNSMS